MTPLSKPVSREDRLSMLESALALSAINAAVLAPL